RRRATSAEASAARSGCRRPPRKFLRLASASRNDIGYASRSLRTGPSTRQCVTDTCSLITWRRNLLSIGIEEHDVLESRQLIFDLRPVADDDNRGILRAEKRGGAALDLFGRQRGDAGAERLRVILRDAEHVDG